MGLKEDLQELKKLKGRKATKKLDEILDKYADEIFSCVDEDIDEEEIEKVQFSEEHERKMEELFKSLRDKAE